MFVVWVVVEVPNCLALVLAVEIMWVVDGLEMVVVQMVVVVDFCLYMFGIVGRSMMLVVVGMHRSIGWIALCCSIGHRPGLTC